MDKESPCWAIFQSLTDLFHKSPWFPVCFLLLLHKTAYHFLSSFRSFSLLFSHLPTRTNLTHPYEHLCSVSGCQLIPILLQLGKWPQLGSCNEEAAAVFRMAKIFILMEPEQGAEAPCWEICHGSSLLFLHRNPRPEKEDVSGML